MKKLFKIVAAILLVSSLSSPVAFAKNVNAKESLVALGDSIPFGYNLGKNNQHPAKTSYPYLIGEDGDLRVRNLGVTGWQSLELLTAVETDQKYRQAISHSDYVAVTIGSNDLLAILRAAAAESAGNPVLFQQLVQLKLANSDVFDNIAETILEIRSLTDSPIVIYNVYNPFQVNDPLHNVAAAFLPNVNGAFIALAYSYDDVSVADAYSAFGNDQATYVIQGDIHPTNAGQAVLSKIGLKALGLD